MIKQRGQSLVEVIVAIGILALVLSGFGSLAAKTLSLNNFLKEKTKAIFLAQEGIEIVKALRDKNPNNFFNYNCVAPNYYLINNVPDIGTANIEEVLGNCVSSGGDDFSKKIEIYNFTSEVGAKGKEIKATVSWQSSFTQKEANIYLTTRLTVWQR